MPAESVSVTSAGHERLGRKARQHIFMSGHESDSPEVEAFLRRVGLRAEVSQETRQSQRRVTKDYCRHTSQNQRPLVARRASPRQN